jgi:S-formylglutathione hydrolase FrmB
MKRISTTLFLMIIALGLRAQGEIVNTTFPASSFGGDEFDVSIYLPEGYDAEDGPYRWVIYLHGCCGDDKEYGLSELTPVLDAKIGAGEIEPLVVVFPDAQSPLFQSSHQWENSATHGAYADLINVDLAEWVEANYKVSTDRCGRVIGGFSSGGVGAVRIAARNIDRYGTAFSHSGPIALEAFINYIPFVLEESPEDMAPYTYPYVVDYGYTWELYVVGSAFSPNPDAEYGVDFPITPEGTLDSAIFYGKWIANHDPVKMLADAQAGAGFPGLGLYFDSGALGIDFLFVRQFNELFTERLTTIGLPHHYIVFEDQGHQVDAARVDSLLTWLDNQWGNCTPVSSTPDLATGSGAALSIAPNPASDWVEVSLSLPNPISGARLEVLHASGQRVQSVVLGSLSAGTHQQRLNIGQLPAGVYLVRLEGIGDGGMRAKLVVR